MGFCPYDQTLNLYIHKMIKMSNSIILFSSLFGSVYLMTKSLEFINRSFLENKTIPRELFIINGFTFMASGTIFIGGSLLNWYKGRA